ncbi:carboxypeptidase-like regulatory domain-containing protein [Thalassoroseus pseudoceratinae]|uniref:carboxypeptidase-like regulatory domain-containing protein n=1 Tax=Thalassoroseus pseudoceratinae TaxID=2713176 RepID=UPI001420773B|nr:carboxypeptidase-like regulatory domain-containing protein [Thalassoroseus pseudoceratinae]
MNWIQHHLGIAAFALWSAALFAGCGGESGPELGEVSGRVLLDGNAVEGASVKFSPVEGGRPSFGTTNANGDYELEYTEDRTGAVLGKHTVEISTGQVSGEESAAGNTEKIPAKYNTQTTLEVEVESGGNEHNFDLKS